MSPAVIIAALAAVVIWGASPVATKLAVADLPPLAVAVLRTVIGGMLALPVALAMRVAPPAAWAERRIVILSGCCGFAIFPLILTYGVVRTSANHASLILASLPVFTGAIAMTWDRVRPKPGWWIGCIIALAGEALLMFWRQGGHAGDSTVLGDALVIGANGFAALGYVSGARLQRAGYASTGTTYWGVFAASLVLAPLLPFALGPVDWSAVGLPSWLAVLYIAIGVTIVGYVLWYWALGKGGIARMGLFQFLQPLSGIALAAVLLGEPVNLGLLLAAALILGGVWIASRAG